MMLLWWRHPLVRTLWLYLNNLFIVVVVSDEVSYSSLIDMQEVKDDSSDFELPDHVVADATPFTQ